MKYVFLGIIFASLAVILLFFFEAISSLRYRSTSTYRHIRNLAICSVNLTVAFCFALIPFTHLDLDSLLFIPASFFFTWSLFLILDQFILCAYSPSLDSHELPDDPDVFYGFLTLFLLGYPFLFGFFKWLSTYFSTPEFPGGFYN